ncbi:MAG: glycerophosphodiester phosphodiesterase [Armatimonadota bacterium]
MSIQCIAHRGFSAAAPENTLAAFRMAIEAGAEFMECDARRAADGLAVIHDATVDRTTDGSGPVADLTLRELAALDAGSWFAPEFAAEGIPSLAEVLDLAKDRITLIVEIKEEGTEDEVVRMVRERGMMGQVIFVSFFEKVGMRLPDLPFGLLVYREEPVGEEEAVRMADEAANVNAVMLGANYKSVTPALVRACHAANMRAMAWTVDDLDEMRRLAEMGVDMIASNRISLCDNI